MEGRMGFKSSCVHGDQKTKRRLAMNSPSCMFSCSRSFISVLYLSHGIDHLQLVQKGMYPCRFCRRVALKRRSLWQVVDQIPFVLQDLGINLSSIVSQASGIRHFER